MWERTARDAADDAGTGDGAAISHALESIDVVYSQSWQYDDAVARLAERLGARPGGGTTRASAARCPTSAPPRRHARSGRATSTSR